MADFGTYTLAQLSALREELQKLASPRPTLREASQVCLDRLYDEFEDSLALIRLFATVPFALLPEREQSFVRNVAATRDVAGELADDTIVVVLIATRGVKAEWNDPAKSRDHLALPLLSASLIRTIPLVGRVLGPSVEDVPWLKRQQSLILTETMGKMSHLLLVEDARTALTGDGFKMVPAQEFVAQHRIKTVLALGGRYLNDVSVALMLFTREQLTHDQATKFTTLINTIKTSTMKAVMAGKLF